MLLFHAAQLVGDVWTLQIVAELMQGCRRFGQLQDSLNRTAACCGSVSISPKTLSQRLKFMEMNGLIVRESFPEIPPRVEYHLTDKGFALRDILQAMSAYEARYLSDGQPHNHAGYLPTDEA